MNKSLITFILICVLSLSSCVFNPSIYLTGTWERDIPADAKEFPDGKNIIIFENDGKNSIWKTIDSSGVEQPSETASYFIYENLTIKETNFQKGIKFSFTNRSAKFYNFSLYKEAKIEKLQLINEVLNNEDKLDLEPYVFSKTIQEKK